MATAARQPGPESLADQFAALHAERVASWEPEALRRNIDQRAALVAAADPARWPQIGSRIADAELIEVDSGAFRLSDEAPLLLIFFRYAGCPACNIALPHYARTLWPAAARAGVAVIAVSPQEPVGLAAIKRRHDLPFAVANDHGNALGRRLGITFEADAATRAQARPGVPTLGEIIGTNSWELPQPTLLLLGASLTVRFVHVSPDWLARTESETAIAAIAALAEPPKAA